ncbi:methyltransferase domain-containing protein [Flavihumibacter sp. CACIAM 22H1]|uniref:methyltransferase domain-containing protein n=1 Tax=Flavihumibacter sp. CACIAM 22H1 TaxID=1812911 RepID=UPI0025C6EEBC|nr:methyltransferase domain-containing protein [Flavihumibacter sp. CACIAM 22H1]
MNKRSTEKELLDDPTMPFEEIQRNMKELNTINSWLGGHAITRSGLRRLIKGHSGSPLTVLEIGCGGGDNLKAIRNWSLTTTIKLRLMGVDINPACISFAEKEFPAASYQVADYRMLRLNEPVDILFSSLFCHHFTDEELVMQLKWMYQHCKRGFFINDLHRIRSHITVSGFLPDCFPVRAS